MRIRILSIVLCLALLVSLTGLFPGQVIADSAQNLAIYLQKGESGSPVLVHSYTRSELQGLASSTPYYYTGLDSMPALVQGKATGVMLNNLITDLKTHYNSSISFGSGDSLVLYCLDTEPGTYGEPYTWEYLLGTQRYYYPNLTYYSSGTIHGSSSGAEAIAPMLAIDSWQGRSLASDIQTREVMDSKTLNDEFAYRISFGMTPSDVANKTITANRLAYRIDRIDIVVTGYNVNIGSLAGGAVTADMTTAAAGDTVTLTVAPRSGKQLKSGTLAVTYNGGQTAALTAGDSNTWTFTMPAYDVTVSAQFEDAALIGTSVSISPISQSAANGETFDVRLAISTDTASRGWQAVLNYDPDQLIANSYTEGGFLKDWTASVGDSTSDQSQGIIVAPGTTNQTGQIDLCYIVTGTANTGGPSGSGTLCTISFTARENINAVASLTLSDVIVSDVNAGSISGVTANNGTVTIGTVALPDLTISAASTSAVAENSRQYTISYTVTNNSTIEAGAFTTSISINGVDVPVLSDSITGLAGNASKTIITAAQTVGSTNTDAIVIAIDSANSVTESSETNNTQAIFHYYIPASGGDTVIIDAFIPGEYTLTPPQSISGWNLKTTPTITGSMNIVANCSWQVTIAAQSPSDGHMISYSAETQSYDPDVTLSTPLEIQSSGNESINLSAVDQVLATGDTSTQSVTGGDTRTVYFTQPITYNDTILDSHHTYHIVLVFTISGMF